MLTASPIHQILDLARWAPSGDNTQPWRFELLDDCRFVIHGFDTRAHCVYDLDGRASQMSLGALIETLSIAATAFGLRAVVTRRMDAPDTHPTFDVTLQPHSSVTVSKLFAAIPLRSVQRGPYSPKRLLADQKSSLERSLDPGYRLLWLEGTSAKWRTALLMFANAKLRLTTEEAYRVHRDIIHWGRRFSPDRVPDQALGADALTLRLMRWAMADWRRVQFLNRYLAGTWLPRLQMDLLPNLMCAAHFVLLRDQPPTTIDHYVESGRMVQRVWLEATLAGIQHQPEVTPLIFSRYVRDGIAFSQSKPAQHLAARLSNKTGQLFGADAARAVWVGRLGRAVAAGSRSTRLSFGQLEWTKT